MFLILQLPCGEAYFSRVWSFGIGALLTIFDLTLLLVSEIPRDFGLSAWSSEPGSSARVEILIGCFPFAVGDGASHVQAAPTCSRDSSRRGLVQLPRQISIPPAPKLLLAGEDLDAHRLRELQC